MLSETNIDRYIQSHGGLAAMNELYSTLNQPTFDPGDPFATIRFGLAPTEAVLISLHAAIRVGSCVRVFNGGWMGRSGRVVHIEHDRNLWLIELLVEPARDPGFYMRVSLCDARPASEE